MREWITSRRATKQLGKEPEDEEIMKEMAKLEVNDLVKSAARYITWAAENIKTTGSEEGIRLKTLEARRSSVCKCCCFMFKMLEEH